MKKLSVVFLVLTAVLFFKCLEIYIFDKDQNIDMAQIQSLDIQNDLSFFLPYVTKDGTHRWSVTGFGFLYLMQKLLSGNAIYLILTVILFLISFKVSLVISQSWSFALIFSYLITLGYNYFIVFFDTRVLGLIFFLIYGLLNFQYFYQIAIENKKKQIPFLITFFLLIFCWDSWIDYALALALLSFLFKAKNKVILNIGLIFFPFYFCIRFLFIGNIREFSGPGREVDFILNYSNLALGLEDFLTNIIRYIHTALTTYFPILPLNPLVVNSPRPIDLLEAFAPGATFQQDALYYNYLYGWYLFAGISFSIFAFSVFKIIFEEKEKLSFILTSGLVLIFFGGFTHYFIKFRPLLVLPYNYTYRQYYSMVGITLIIAFIGDYIFLNKINGEKTKLVFLILFCLCFTGMSFLKTKRAIDHRFIHNKLNPSR